MNAKIVTVVGAGIIGEAVIRTLIKSGYKGSEISIIEKRQDRVIELQKAYGVAQGGIEKCQTFFLTVKPQDFDGLIEELKSSLKPESLVISLMAGVKIQKIEKKCSPDCRVIRVMTNTPILAGEGMSVVSLSKSASKEDADWVCGVFSKQGRVLLLDEEYMDFVTAISGSGPAYFFAFAEALTKAAIKLGLPSTDALNLVRQTFLGSARLMADRDKDFSFLKGEVTSRGGTTEAALAVFDSMNLEVLVEEAVNAATAKSIQLSNLSSNID